MNRRCGAPKRRSGRSRIDPADLLALERAPLDPRAGFDLPERVPGAETVPAVEAVFTILGLLGAAGVAVGIDGTFDAATGRAISGRLGGQARDIRGETDAPLVRTARRLAEAAGLIERRLGRARHRGGAADHGGRHRGAAAANPAGVGAAAARRVRPLRRRAFLGLAEVERGTALEDHGRVLRVRATPAPAEVVAVRTLRNGT